MSDPDQPASDPIRPDYYRRGGIEVADVADAYDLSRWRTLALKYILRAGEKDPAKTAEDLRKCLWYVNREIARMEARP